jgi:hypothetical protein
MLILLRNSTVMGVFDNKEILSEQLFKESDLSATEVEELVEEDCLELPEGCRLSIEEFKENSLDGFFSRYDLCADDFEPDDEDVPWDNHQWEDL